MRFGPTLAVLLALPLAACATAPPNAGPRPRQWAAPVPIEGCPNLHRIDGTLYRCAQPEPEGFAALERMGVRTVVSLRALHPDRPPQPCSLELVSIPMLTWNPSDDDIARFLELATDPARRPLVVHCQHGADRTGLLCAAYRVVVQGWTKDEAIAEMTAGGFGFHPIWDGLVERVRELDVERFAGPSRAAPTPDVPVASPRGRDE
jgi:protein tyrosine phosphatase (PTP) superfamily phosphohydrolase (DUF442 family)